MYMVHVHAVHADPGGLLNVRRWLGLAHHCEAVAVIHFYDLDVCGGRTGTQQNDEQGGKSFANKHIHLQIMGSHSAHGIPRRDPGP